MPLLRRRKRWFHEADDPCFGGNCTISTSSYTEQGSQQKGTIHVVHDTTDRHEAEEKYRLIFEQAQEGVFVATPAGKLLDCNDAFVRMLGFPNREELMAMDLETELSASAEQRDEFRRKSNSQLRAQLRNDVASKRRNRDHGARELLRYSQFPGQN